MFDINSAIGSGANVTANVNGGVVTLSGYFADSGDKNIALQIAKTSEGVDRVIDLTTASNSVFNKYKQYNAIRLANLSA